MDLLGAWERSPYFSDPGPTASSTTGEDGLGADQGRPSTDPRVITTGRRFSTARTGSRGALSARQGTPGPGAVVAGDSVPTSVQLRALQSQCSIEIISVPFRAGCAPPAPSVSGRPVGDDHGCTRVDLSACDGRFGEGPRRQLATAENRVDHRSRVLDVHGHRTGRQP
jgi:hypothetical protein